MAKKMTKAQIRAALIAQLEAQNKTAAFYIDLVDDYMHYIELKNMLLADIKKEGVRRRVPTGNGYEAEKPNESVKNVNTTTATMLKLLNDLGLKDPVKAGDSPDDYL